MTRPGSREIAPSVLRDHATPERVDRVWARIERDLPARAPAPARFVSPWAVVVGSSLFLAGVFVGLRFGSEPAPVAALAPEPERAPVLRALPAAAEQQDDVAETGPSRRERRSPRLRAPARRPLTPAPATSAPAEPEAIPVTGVAAAPPVWQGLADEGHYDEALIAVEGQGGFDAVVTQATAEQLMLLVDVARATGRHERAVMALRRVVNQHGSDPNAPLAAWMLGNELARSGDPDGAAQAFAMYRALSPQGDFAQDALTRQFEVAVEQRDLEQAERLADQYARDFPEAPRLDEIHGQLEELRRAIAAEPTDPAERKGEVDGPGAAGPGLPPFPDPSRQGDASGGAGPSGKAPSRTRD